MKTKLISNGCHEGQYGFLCHWMLLAHEDGYLVVLQQGWGGGDIEGECYRWKHGCAYTVKKGVTEQEILERLKSDEYPTFSSSMWSLPLNWEPKVVSAVALSHDK